MTHTTKDVEGYLKQPKQNHETQLGIYNTRTKNINLPNTDKKRKTTSLDNQINLWRRTTVERAKLSEVIGQEQALILYNFSPINLEILDMETDKNKSRFLSFKYMIVSFILIGININIWMSQFTEHNKKINQILFVQYDQSNKTHIHTLNVVAAFILELLSNSVSTGP